MAPLSYEEALAAVRREVARYYDDDFHNDQELYRELRICSDDLTAMSLKLEKALRIKLPQSDYDEILTTTDWARAFHRRSSEASGS